MPKTLEDKYKKFTQIQHALEKSGMYIGSIENVKESTWSWDEKKQKMIWSDVVFNKGLQKIYD